MKAKETKAAAAAIKRIFATVENVDKAQYKGQYKTGDMYSFFGPFITMTADAPIPGIPELDNIGQTDPATFLQNYIDNPRYRRSCRDYHTPEHVPTLEELKAWRRQEDGKNLAFPIQDGDQQIGVSTRYLIDLMTVFPGLRLYVSGPLDIIILSDENLQPVAGIAPVILDLNRKGIAKRRTA